MGNSKEIKDFIKSNSSLFWYTSGDKKKDINIEFLVETVLNYGNLDSVKELLNLLGIEKVAEIFYFQTHRQRVNYFPQVINFFELYFRRHVPGYSNR